MKKIIFNVNNVNTELTSEKDEVIVFDNSGEYHYYKGKLHCEDGPAVITDEYVQWFKHGVVSRDYGPAVTRKKISNIANTGIELPISILYKGSEYGYGGYYNNNNIGISESDIKDFVQTEYWENGKLHRVDHPAVEIRFEYEGNKYLFEYWFLNGVSFNPDGWSSYGNNITTMTVIFFKNTNAKGELHSNDDSPSYYKLYDNNLKDKLNLKIHYKNGIQYRENDLPCYISDTEEIWHNAKGELHREHGPVIIKKNKEGGIVSEQYYKNGLLSRNDGPAVVYYLENGKTNKKYYIKGKRINYLSFILIHDMTELKS